MLGTSLAGTEGCDDRDAKAAAQGYRRRPVAPAFLGVWRTLHLNMENGPASMISLGRLFGPRPPVKLGSDAGARLGPRRSAIIAGMATIYLRKTIRWASPIAFRLEFFATRTSRRQWAALLPILISVAAIFGAWLTLLRVGVFPNSNTAYAIGLTTIYAIGLTWLLWELSASFLKWISTPSPRCFRCSLRTVIALTMVLAVFSLSVRQMVLEEYRRRHPDPLTAALQVALQQISASSRHQTFLRRNVPAPPTIPASRQTP